MTFYEEHGIIKTGTLHDALHMPMVKEAFGWDTLARGGAWLVKKFISSGVGETAAAGTLRNIGFKAAPEILPTLEGAASKTIAPGKASAKIFGSPELKALGERIDPLGGGSHLTQALKNTENIAKARNVAPSTLTDGVTNRAMLSFSPKKSIAVVAEGGKIPGSFIPKDVSKITHMAQTAASDYKEAGGGVGGVWNALKNRVVNDWQNAKYYTHLDEKTGLTHLMPRSAIGTVGNFATMTPTGVGLSAAAMGASAKDSAIDVATMGIAPEATGMYYGGKMVTDFASSMFTKKPKTKNIEQGVSNVIQ